MEFFCPECMGTLQFVSAETARCPLDGREYRILFSRIPLVAAPVAPSIAPAKLTEEAKCAFHPGQEAFYLCRSCGVPLCVTCSFPQGDDTHLCPTCVLKPQPVAATPPIKGIMCVQHPTVAAVQLCNVCGAGVCATCDFAQPGEIHVCPRCMTASRDELAPKRKKLMIWSYVLAIWCTFGMAVLFSGAVAGEQSLAALVGYAIFIPSLIGTALGFSAVDRRLVNPISLWIAAIWNGLLLVIYLVLIFIGLSMR
jgi:hypothetical protein